MPSQDLTYCGELVRRHDPDRFLITLKMLPERRKALWALYAFNHEIAKTREVVTETTIGLIRLQWWRDALEKIYEEDSVLQNEILPDLYAAIKNHELPREPFDKLVYAREFDLENVLPASLDGLVKYADYTGAPLLRLGLEILGQSDDEKIVRDIAAAYGLTGLLRAVPFHAQQQRCYMPADLMAECKIDERALYDLKPGEAFIHVTKTVGEKAQHLLQSAPQSRLLKAHKRVAGLYLRQLEKLNYDVFAPALALPPPFYHLRFAFWPL